MSSLVQKHNSGWRYRALVIHIISKQPLFCKTCGVEAVLLFGCSGCYTAMVKCFSWRHALTDCPYYSICCDIGKELEINNILRSWQIKEAIREGLNLEDF